VALPAADEERVEMPGHRNAHAQMTVLDGDALTAFGPPMIQRAGETLRVGQISRD